MPFIKYTPPPEQCHSDQHKPPMYQLLKKGTHVWQCPACNEETTIESKDPEYRAMYDRAILEERQSTHKESFFETL